MARGRRRSPRRRSSRRSRSSLSMVEAVRDARRGVTALLCVEAVDRRPRAGADRRRQRRRGRRDPAVRRAGATVVAPALEIDEAYLQGLGVGELIERGEQPAGRRDRLSYDLRRALRPRAPAFAAVRPVGGRAARRADRRARDPRPDLRGRSPSGRSRGALERASASTSRASCRSRRPRFSSAVQLRAAGRAIAWRRPCC